MAEPIEQKATLPRPLHPAIAWAQAGEQQMLAQGKPLDTVSIRFQVGG
jgi:hypothetical protein